MHLHFFRGEWGTVRGVYEREPSKGSSMDPGDVGGVAEWLKGVGWEAWGVGVVGVCWKAH